LVSKQEQVIDLSKPIVVDGTNLIAGRVCSNVAKLLRKGNRVSIVNCEKIMISGKKASIIGEYEDFLKIHSIIHPQHGPFHPRRPDTIIKRMIRGMLPKEKPSKKTDLARLRTYIGVPKEVKSFEKIQFENSKITRLPSRYTTMAELSRYIGGTNF
jgi:large subunit ribosomal protein L13|tara:strand:- start:1596 stop:2063 length:468 start_codon:yes stop_codon:yes gene_type:complete